MKHVIRQGNFVIYINLVTLQVANLACSMSGNEDGVKMVRYAAAQIENLCPQVINAARILAARPRSKVAQENMDVFRDAWENQVRILTEAVDDITTIDDFLAVSGVIFCHVLIKCVMAWGSDSELPYVDIIKESSEIDGVTTVTTLCLCDLVHVYQHCQEILQ